MNLAITAHILNESSMILATSLASAVASMLEENPVAGTVHFGAP